MKKKKFSGISVVIPARNETSGDIAVLSLIDNKNRFLKTDIWVVINASDHDLPEIHQSNLHLKDKLNSLRSKLPDNYRLHIILETQIPLKIAGVGYARKLGIDRAAEFYNNGGEVGLIVCFDADCQAPEGYLERIHKVMSESDSDLAAISYSHLTTENTDSIQAYEAMLRYYSLSLQRSGYPFWHQTVGSCIAVRSDVYLKHGGMNTRKAGEDFYFMHKLMPVCATTTIIETENYLSPRESDRVPFGTGRAMLESFGKRIPVWYTYHPQIFKELSSFIDQLHTNSIDHLLEGKTWVHEFLIHHNCSEDIFKINRNTGSKNQFIKSFFQYFNGFRVLKYIHWCRDQHVSNVPVQIAIESLVNEASKKSISEILTELKQLERLAVSTERRIQ